MFIWLKSIKQASIGNKLFPVTIYGYKKVGGPLENPAQGSAPKWVGLGISGGRPFVIERCVALATTMMAERLVIEQATATNSPPQTLTLEISGSIQRNKKDILIGKQVENEKSIQISNFIVSGYVLHRGERPVGMN
ncbi:MAG: hypothetical protein EXR74_09205 [Bdellovibrionales bacterium]|nr:hypothetical protein [Bdellovibrionales bacterium]